MIERKKRILIGGYINTNVLEGSAIFISSLTQVISMNKDAQIDVLLAVPYLRDVVLKPLEKIENINIIDPFQNEDYAHILLNKNSMETETYAELIAKIDSKGHYDLIIIRSFEVVESIISHNSHLLNRLFAYITGITDSNHQITNSQNWILSSVTENGGKLLCQTPEMKDFILGNTNINSEDIIYLNPMIPNANIPFQYLFKKKNTYNTFCYTGKFADEWNIIQMITQFREINEKYPSTKLYIAGDQFKKSDLNPLFVNNAKYLLKNSKNVIWLGAIPREKSIALIKQSDIGLTYRHKVLDNSLELSTKLLEYCSQAVPPILNKNDMHIRIFGENYPYFANSDEQLYNVMELIITNSDLYEETAKKVYEIAKEYSFISTYSRIAPYIGGNNSTQEPDLQYLFLDDSAEDKLKQLFTQQKVVDFKYENGVISYKSINGEKNTIEEIVDMLILLRDKVQIEEISFDVKTIEEPKVDQNLMRENRKLKNDIKLLRERYNNLSKSKLGSIQKNYWKFKNKNK